MKNDKFEHDENQIYFVFFLLFLVCLIIYVAVTFWWVKAPNMDTKTGRCEAFCAGLGKVLVGKSNDDQLPLTCFCDHAPVPIDKRMLRRP